METLSQILFTICIMAGLAAGLALFVTGLLFIIRFIMSLYKN